MNGTAGVRLIQLLASFVELTQYQTSAAQQAQETYAISRSLSVFVFTSTYLLGQAVGGTFFPPFSEAFGRKFLYVASTISYCIFTVIVAAVPSLAVGGVCRFIAGVLSAIPAVVVAGSIEDMFNIRGRVWMIWIWALVGTAGLSLGPIFSTFVTLLLGW